MSILIVGGAGYIGSQTAKRVAQAGLTPVVFDNLVYGHKWAVKWGPFVEGDLADDALIRRMLEQHAVTAVVHFAAFAYVGESVTNPRKYFRNNVAGTVNLLDAMVDAGVRDIVFSSTCATSTASRCACPSTKTHPQRPVNPYGESKLAVERMLHWYGSALRAAVRGAALLQRRRRRSRRRGRRGSRSGDAPHPARDRGGAGRQEDSTIYGTDYATPDGTAIRDYIHVQDLADAHVAALDTLRGGAASLSRQPGHRPRALGARGDRGGGEGERQEGPGARVARRAGDPPALVADARLAADVLGWQARIPNIETIVEHAWRWRQTRADGARLGRAESVAGGHGDPLRVPV